MSASKTYAVFLADSMHISTKALIGTGTGTLAASWRTHFSTRLYRKGRVDNIIHYHKDNLYGSFIIFGGTYLMVKKIHITCEP